MKGDNKTAAGFKTGIKAKSKYTVIPNNIAIGSVHFFSNVFKFISIRLMQRYKKDWKATTRNRYFPTH